MHGHNFDLRSAGDKNGDGAKNFCVIDYKLGQFEQKAIRKHL